MLGHVMEAYWELQNVFKSQKCIEKRTSVKNTISTLQDGAPVSL